MKTSAESLQQKATTLTFTVIANSVVILFVAALAILSEGLLVGIGFIVIGITFLQTGLAQRAILRRLQIADEVDESCSGHEGAKLSEASET